MRFRAAPLTHAYCTWQADSIYRYGKKQLAVGVLVGPYSDDRRVFGEVMYQSFHVSGMFVCSIVAVR